jgi:hypothetical protein
MEILNQIRAQIERFEQKEFYTHVGAFFGIIVALIVGILYYYYSSVFSLQKKLKRVNSKREEAQRVVKKLNIVKKQKDEVETLLAADKSFKIKSFFDDTIKQLNIANKQRREAEVSEEVVQKKYLELKITAQFRALSMEQLSKLIDALEKKSRIYTKELSITKVGGASIDVTLTIATLKQQSDGEQRK